MLGECNIKTRFSVGDLDRRLEHRVWVRDIPIMKFMLYAGNECTRNVLIRRMAY